MRIPYVASRMIDANVLQNDNVSLSFLIPTSFDLQTNRLRVYFIREFKGTLEE